MSGRRKKGIGQAHPNKKKASFAATASVREYEPSEPVDQSAASPTPAPIVACARSGCGTSCGLRGSKNECDSDRRATVRGRRKQTEAGAVGVARKPTHRERPCLPRRRCTRGTLRRRPTSSAARATSRRSRRRWSRRRPECRAAGARTPVVANNKCRPGWMPWFLVLSVECSVIHTATRSQLKTDNSLT